MTTQLRELPFDPLVEIEIGVTDNHAYARCYGSTSEDWLFYRDTRAQAHFESIETLEFEGLIPVWQRDVVNFPLRNHPFLSGQEKFDAMLEVQKCMLNTQYHLFTAYEISPRG